MAKRKIFEAELDGCSIIVWEAGIGTRVVYPTPSTAELAAEWLIDIANKFHSAKESNTAEDEGMVSLVLYGDQPLTEFAFIRGYLARMRLAGYEVIGGLTRSQKEVW